MKEYLCSCPHCPVCVGKRATKILIEGRILPVVIGGKRKFHPKRRELTKEESEARDKRFQEALARYEALPETIALREAVKRSGDVDLRIRMNV